MGGSVVLKPANRQAAVGTLVLADPDEVDAAWDDCLYQDEGNLPAGPGIPVRMLVERVHQRRGIQCRNDVRAVGPGFGNVTGKVIYPGARPVERGTPCRRTCRRSWPTGCCAETVRVLDAVGLRHRVRALRVDRRRRRVPYLVECAGRIPGDGIIDLIEYAWDMLIVDYYLDFMQRPPLGGLPAAAPRAGAVWFLDPGTGKSERRGRRGRRGRPRASWHDRARR